MRFVCKTCIRQSPEDLKSNSDCANCKRPEIEAQIIEDKRDIENTGVQIWEKKNGVCV